MYTKFIVSVVRHFVNEEGLNVSCKEDYLTDAVTFGDAETITIAEVEASNQRVDVKAVKGTGFAEIFRSEDDDAKKYYKVKVNVWNQADNGKMKKSSFDYLVQATDTADADKRINAEYKQTMVDHYEIDTIKETKIVDIINDPDIDNKINHALNEAANKMKN